MVRFEAILGRSLVLISLADFRKLHFQVCSTSVLRAFVVLFGRGVCYVGSRRFYLRLAFWASYPCHDVSFKSIANFCREFWSIQCIQRREYPPETKRWYCFLRVLACLEHILCKEARYVHISRSRVHTKKRALPLDTDINSDLLSCLYSRSSNITLSFQVGIFWRQSSGKSDTTMQIVLALCNLSRWM